MNIAVLSQGLLSRIVEIATPRWMEQASSVESKQDIVAGRLNRAKHTKRKYERQSAADVRSKI